MVSVLASSVLDREFELSRVNPKTETDICCFSDLHAELRRKSKDWLAQNEDNVLEWIDMSVRSLLCQWDSTIEIQVSVLV